ncbi:OadG family protein [Chloroflexota bacterium]
MGIDWVFAVKVGGVGFGMVFVLLIILAMCIWLTGLVVNKTSAVKDKTDDAKKGD